MKKQNKKTANKRTLVKKDKDIIKKMTIEETKDFINQIACLNDDPERIIEKLSEDLSSETQFSKVSKKAYKKIHEAIEKAQIAYGLDTHYPFVQTVYKRYKPLAIEFSRQLVKEYDCKTSGEKALAEVVVNAYIRVLEFSALVNSIHINLGDITNVKNGFYLIIGKELDRANRQFIAALTTLKQLKTPSLEINIRAKAAFVAQNQQLNVNPPNIDNSNKNENIKPK